jgi:hypothetical protein
MSEQTEPVVHRAPLPLDETMPCCHRLPSTLPTDGSHLLTDRSDLVTCSGYGRRGVPDPFDEEKP